MTEPSQPDRTTRSSLESDTAAIPLSPDATRQVLQDLRVHQIELELQNEELRRAQQQVETSRARYFDLYDMAPVGYFTLSQTGLIEEANFAAAGLLGMQRGALVSRPLTRFIFPDDQDVYYRQRKKLLEAGVRQQCEIRMVKSDGGLQWVQLEATSAEDSSGALVFRVVMVDIGGRKRAEATLQASETRHRVLFEKSHDALMTLAPPDWRFTAGNSKTLEMFGVKDVAQFVSHSALEYSPERQSDGALSTEKAKAMIEIAMREGSHFYEWTYRNLSGQQFPCCVLLTRLEIDGQPLLQATVRDETEIRKLQALLAQTDRLASMGMLAASVAHEINNPLASVLYNAEVLAQKAPKLAGAVERCVLALRASLGDEAFAKVIGNDAGLLEAATLQDFIECARAALTGTQRIRNISRAIGTFSRVESTERSRVDLNYAIECAATMARNDLRFRARLEMDLRRVPFVWASEGKLSQVFLNLLINAAQAIGEGEAGQSRIQIRTWVEGTDVFAEVEDNGNGIDEANLAHVFDPFFTTKAVGEGSGLGLCICRNIITEFGGDLTAESEVGRGTCFTLRLPIQKGVSTMPRDSAAEKPALPIVRGRVLVVDDEQPIRTLITRLLGSEHEMTPAASGLAARAILERDQSFDVILCDLMMPEMTGMDLHKWLEVNHPTLAQRVVFMTGGAFSPQASDYVTRVGNVRLEKPFDTAMLTRLVSELVATAKKK